MFSYSKFSFKDLNRLYFLTKVNISNIDYSLYLYKDLKKVGSIVPKTLYTKGSQKSFELL